MTTPEPVIAEAVTAETSHHIGRPVMIQGWYDLAALHWRYEPRVVQALQRSIFRAVQSWRLPSEVHLRS